MKKKSTTNWAKGKKEKITSKVIVIGAFLPIVVCVALYIAFPAIPIEFLLCVSYIAVCVPLFKWSKRAKKKIAAEETATQMLSSARLDLTIANEAHDVNAFLEHYDRAISTLEKLRELESTVKFAGSVPSVEYFKLKNDRQWHLRDAIENECSKIFENESTIYRNNHKRFLKECELFIEELNTLRHHFDDDTSVFADDIICRVQQRAGFAEIKADAANNRTGN